MTIAQMHSLMGLQLEDVNHDLISQTNKDILLNKVQRLVVSMLHRNLRDILDFTDTDKVLDEEGKFAFTDLTKTIYYKNKGIDGIRLKDGRFCNLISFDEWRDYQDVKNVFSTGDPIFYLRGANFYVEPFNDTDVDSGDISEDTVYYVVDYTTVVYNGVTYNAEDSFTGVSGVTTYITTGSGSVIAAVQVDVYYYRDAVDMSYSTPTNCELEEEIQDIIVDLATSEGYDIQDNVSSEAQARKYENRALNAISILNLQFPPTDTIKRNIERFRTTNSGSIRVRQQYVT